MEHVIVQNPDEDPTAKKIAYIIYILYILSIMIPLLPIIAIIFAYIFVNDAKTILKSHYQYLIRSFWIGLLYFSISLICFAIVIGVFLLGLFLIWWIIRMVKGLKSLLKNEPIAHPKTWIF